MDAFQTNHSLKRNYPIIARLRYLMEDLRPEIQQYFIEADTDGRPFNRVNRSVIYQRSKSTQDTIAFGTLEDVYAAGYEWVNHSMAPVHVDKESLRVDIGGPDCKKPYNASIFNISAMSYGALSHAATESLNLGAKLGNFAHNTGEGGISSYHLKNGGDLIWQVGTAYYGCRTKDGKFDKGLFTEKANYESIKMIEIKVSQGAKPGHGGILPARKITPEIAEIRGVPMDRDAVSPPAHTAFTTPIGMMEFVAELREASSGKPVGIKLCIGKRREFIALCKAMVETGITPDYIAIDGGEGGTGAAPMEYASSIGCPSIEGLIFAYNALVGFDLKSKIKVIASGKITNGFSLLKKLALGADLCYGARCFMLALGCIQSLKCNKNVCPVGVATTDENLIRGLHVPDKCERVSKFHGNTLQSMAEIMGTMGCATTNSLRPWNIMRRVSQNEIHHYGEMFHYLEKGELLQEPFPKDYERAVRAATAQTFQHAHHV